MKLDSTIINFLKVFATILVFLCHSTIVAKECFDASGFIAFFNTPAWGGVWMFLIISGFLASYGFEVGRYELTKDSVSKYYKGRIIKILLPTWLFLLLLYIFNMKESNVEFEGVIRMLTCTYNGGPIGISGAGATWYVFMLMWLYLFSPLFVHLLQLFEKKHCNEEYKSYLRLLLLVVLLGMFYRVAGYLLHLDVYNWLYANVLACIDLYVAGMLGVKILKFCPYNSNVNYISKINKMRPIILSLFFLMNISLIARGKFEFVDFFYRYLSPSFYIVFLILLILLYSVEIKQSQLSRKGCVGKFCNAICPYTFAFYLWHSNLLVSVAVTFNITNDNNKHFLIMLVIGLFVISFISYLMTIMNNSIIKALSK